MVAGNEESEGYIAEIEGQLSYSRYCYGYS